MMAETLDIKRMRSCSPLLPEPGDEVVRQCLDEIERLRSEQHLAALAEEIRKINAANGWNVTQPHDWDENAYKVPAILALIHSEVSEALEAYRKGDRENFGEEMADIVIRVLDACPGLGVDIDAEVAKKLERNRQRGYRHGGKRV